MAESRPSTTGGGTPPSTGTGQGYASVALPSGAFYPVLNVDEERYLTEHVRLYTEHHAFVNISDLSDLDKVLSWELLTYRWGVWLSVGLDYSGKTIDEDSLRKQSKEWSLELRQLKKALQIDKLSRDKAKGEGSLPHYIAQLHYRAGVFGVMRSKQAAKAIELMQEMLALITFHKNCTPAEREQQHVTADDIVQWADTICREEFDTIDAEFRATDQRYWIRSQ